MQIQESSDEPSENPSADQNFQLEGISAEKVYAGGQAGENLSQVVDNQIAGNFTQNFHGNRAQNEDTWTKEQLLQFQQQEDILRAEFQKDLDHAKSLLKEIRRKLEERLDIKPLKEKYELLKLIDELQSLLRHEITLESIENDSVFEHEATIWLIKNKSYIEQYVVSKIFSKKLLFTHLRKKRHGHLSIDELRERFRNDVSHYMYWIKSYLQAGRTPVNFNKKLVYLDFVSDIYREAFVYITDELLDPDVSELSIDAAETIASYINQFLIRRNLDSDLIN
jgi:hypothetical protein